MVIGPNHEANALEVGGCRTHMHIMHQNDVCVQPKLTLKDKRQPLKAKNLQPLENPPKTKHPPPVQAAFPILDLPDTFPR
jgi:hypothetical protein